MDAMRAAVDHWWAFALRGVAALIFGILGFAWPGVTLAALVVFWGAYALIDGVLALLSAFRTAQDHRWALLVEGIVGIGAGVVTFVWPGLTALVLVYIIAFWALMTGVLEIAAALRLRKVIHNEWRLALSGALSLVFGIALLASPGTGAIALVWLIAAYAVIFGAMLLALAFRLWSMGQGRHAQAAA